MQNNSPLRICPNSPKAVNVTLHGKADFADVIKVTDILNNRDGPNVITQAFKNGREMQKGRLERCEEEAGNI